MLMTVHTALLAPVNDGAWIAVGIAAVLVAVTPLAVLVRLARPRRRRSKR